MAVAGDESLTLTLSLGGEGTRNGAEPRNER
jgi:hypothetical protein